MGGKLNDMGKWRPLCFESQWTRWRDACEQCPFSKNCKYMTELNWERFKAKYGGE